MNITLKLLGLLLLVPAEVLAVNLFWYALSGVQLLPEGDSETLMIARIFAFGISAVAGCAVTAAAFVVE